jgi:ankyrin repeat protein
MKLFFSTIVLILISSIKTLSSPLHEAAHNGDLDAIQIQLNNGIDVNLRNPVQRGAEKLQYLLLQNVVIMKL